VRFGEAEERREVRRHGPRAAVAEAIERFVQPDGSVRLDNVFRVVVAHA
jgi:hypothetical protein